MPTEDLTALAEGVRAADIGIIALPITNLYLQGWDAEHAVPRGIAPIGRLKAAGVRVAAGADNVRDPFNPVGRCDHLETASLLVAAGHLAPEDAVDAVTTGARDVMGLPQPDPSRAPARTSSPSAPPRSARPSRSPPPTAWSSTAAASSPAPRSPRAPPPPAPAPTTAPPADAPHRRFRPSSDRKVSAP